MKNCLQEGNLINENRCKWFYEKRASIVLLSVLFTFGFKLTAGAAETDLFSSGHRYHLVVSDCTWDQAFQFSKDAGGHLASFESLDEYNQFLSQLNNSQGMSGIRFWIGGRRDINSQEYHWVDGNNNLYGEVLNNSSSWVYPMWMKAEPSFMDGDIVENYMDLFFYDKENRWVMNDVPGDIISILPEYSGKLGYIIEFDEEGAAQADLQDQNVSAAWQEAYRDFITNERYLLDEGTRFANDEYASVSYTLRDMNQDGIPELIIFNGDGVYAGSVDYLYSFSGGAVNYAGTMASSYYENYVSVDGFPGIFSSGAHTGGYWTDYYGFDGTSVTSESVWSGSDYMNYDPVTGDNVIKEVSHTDSEALYNAYLLIENGGGTPITFITREELSQKGFDRWLEECSYTQSAPEISESPEPSSVLASMPGEFYFYSGAGAWGTSMVLEKDGSFTGSFHDSNMGADNDIYPGGEVLVSDFSGRFVNFSQVDDYTYSMHLSEVDYEIQPGVDWTDGTVHYIAGDAYGIADGDLFYLYLPGHPVNTLPEGYMNWARLYMYGNEDSPTLPFYGIYNVARELGWGS